MNYGRIGSVIGHEMIHAFDDSGRRFDKNGNLVDWWDPATKANFAERTKCILNQYDNYIVKLVGDKVSQWFIKLIFNSIELIDFCFEGDRRQVKGEWDYRWQWRFQTCLSCVRCVGSCEQTGTSIAKCSLYIEANVLDKHG